MTDEQWSGVEHYFSALSELAEEERPTALAAITDEAVRREVASLLLHAGAGETIHSAVGAMASQVDTATPSPQRIGPYRIVRRLGQGGQGAVFEAVRDDGRFQQRVAVKIVQWEMDSAASRERFRQERQILAGLEHPNIARLLDGGETENGAPYLVMEYVDGQSLTKSARDWPVRRKLELFLQVAAAVSYAHRNLIVHRDLKPANILVTADGTPKLLDFGIAKLLDTDPQRTATAMQALTPDYASPEQVRGEPITTACDIYALGIVLYELLTARRPYEVRTVSPVEMHRIVCLTDPPPAGISEDLDNILRMAMRKEPERRYGSVEDFAEDIRRSLSHRPVKARADSFAYRASRFVRRNRLAVAAAGVVAATLTIGVALTVRAEREAQTRFEEVRQLATRFLVDFDRDIRQLPGSTGARERLVSTALEYLDRLAKSSSRDPRLMSDLVAAYRSVADVVGMPGLPSLGHMDRAEQSYRRSCELAKRLVERFPGSSGGYRADACISYSRLGYLLWRTNRTEEGRRMMLEGLAFLQPKLAAGTATVPEFRAMANAFGYLGSLETQEGHIRLAQDAARRALDLMRRYQAATPGFRPRSDLARSTGVAGKTAMAAGDLESALALYNEEIGIRSQLLAENTHDVETRRELATAFQARADIEYRPGSPSLGQEANALRSEREAILIYRKLATEDPRNASAKHDLALALNELALRESQDPQQAIADLREGIALLQAMPANFAGRDRHIGLLYTTMFELLADQKRFQDARTALTNAEPYFAKEPESDSLARGDLVALWQAHGRMALMRGAVGEAIAAFKKVWGATSTRAGVEDVREAFRLASVAGSLAEASLLAKDAAGAADWEARKTEIWQPWAGKFPVSEREWEK